jgi:hypothetical protein
MKEPLNGSINDIWSGKETSKHETMATPDEYYLNVRFEKISTF